MLSSPLISDDVGAKLKSALWQERLPPDSASVSAPDAAAWRATFWGVSRMGDPKLSFLAEEAMVLGTTI